MRNPSGICLLSLLAAGCFTPPPPHDPLAGLQLPTADPAFKDLAVGLAISETTRETSAFVDKWNTQYFGAGKLPEPERWIKEFADFLRDNFKSVAKISAAEGSSPRVDLIAVLDMHYDRMAFKTWDSAQVSMKTVLVTPSRVPIAEALGQVASGARGFKTNTPFYIGLISQALREMEQKIISSRELAEFARAKGGRPAAVDSASPIPERRPAPEARRSKVDKPAYQAAEKADHFAFIVGIENYESLPKADFAEHDAETVREHLAALGYPRRNIVFLAGGKAGKAGMEKYLQAWLPRNVPDGGKVLFYFSGHGAPDPRTGEAYLVPWDGDPKFIENTGYPLKRLYRELGALRAKEVIVALDACFSGAGGRSVLAKGARPLVTKVDLGSDLGKLVVLSAAAGDEITGTDEIQGHGLFTYHLLNALNAKGAGATAKELFDALLPMLQEAARRDNRDQTPQLLGSRTDVRLSGH